MTICLLGEQPREKTFYVNESFWASSTIRINSNKSIQAPVKSFNEEVYKINPTFLILDIEGGEYDLLQFADFHTIKKIVIELHPHFLGQEKLDFVMSGLKDAGFHVNKKVSCTKQLLLQRN